MNTKSSEISTLSTLVILDRCLCNSLNQSPLSHQMQKNMVTSTKLLYFQHDYYIYESYLLQDPLELLHMLNEFCPSQTVTLLEASTVRNLVTSFCLSVYLAIFLLGLDNHSFIASSMTWWQSLVSGPFTAI